MEETEATETARSRPWYILMLVSLLLLGAFFSATVRAHGYLAIIELGPENMRAWAVDGVLSEGEQYWPRLGSLLRDPRILEVTRRTISDALSERYGESRCPPIEGTMLLIDCCRGSLDKETTYDIWRFSVAERYKGHPRLAPLFARLMNDEDKYVRDLAQEVLQGLIEDDASILDKILRTGSNEERAGGFQFLLNSSPSWEEVPRDLLFESLQSENELLRFAAARLIVEIESFGRETSVSVEIAQNLFQLMMVDTWRDSKDRVLISALILALSLEKEAVALSAKTRALLQRLLISGDADRRSASALILLMRGQQKALVLAVIGEAMQRSPMGIDGERLLLKTLRKDKHRSEEALTIVKSVLSNSHDEGNILQAIEFLDHFPNHVDALVPLLTKLASENEAVVRAAVCRTLLHCKERDDKVWTFLRSAINDDDAAVEQAARLTWRAFGGRLKTKKNGR